MTGWRIFNSGTLISIAFGAILGTFLLTSVDAQERDDQGPNTPGSEAPTPELPEACPNDDEVQVSCRRMGTLVKKWVCETQNRRGVSDDLADAVRIACRSTTDD